MTLMLGAGALAAVAVGWTAGRLLALADGRRPERVGVTAPTAITDITVKRAVSEPAATGRRAS